MVKNSIILSLLISFFLPISEIRAQNSIIEHGTITYEVEGETAFAKILEKLGETDSLNTPEMSRARNLLATAMNPITFELKIQGSKSKFRVVDAVLPDETTRINMNRLLARSVGTIYIDESSKYVLQNREVHGLEYFIDYSTEYYEWNLTEEEKLVNGYTCRKATCKRINATDSSSLIEAWYSTEFNNSIGPAGYGGLPGLILELRTTGITTYKVTDIFQPVSSKLKIEIPDPDEVIDIESFPAVLKKLNEEAKGWLGQY